jgi:hypothetical protein
MKIATALPTEHQLDQLAGQFEHWRHTRAHPSACIPQPLWDQAVALTTVLPYTRVAKHLRLSAKDLKTHMAAESAPCVGGGSTTARFVEVPPQPAQPQVAGGLEVELYRTDGARLRMHAPDASLPLAAIVRSFLEA